MSVIVEIIIMGIDITSEVVREKAVEETLRMKNEFLSFISHEFRTPLTVISSAIQAMELTCGKELSLKAKGYINKIRQNTLRQLRLVNNLLDIARAKDAHIKIRKRNMDIVHLTKAIAESVSPYAEQKGVKLTFSSAVSQKFIAVDDEKYERILLNLLSNALKFTPQGRSVHVRVSLSKGKVCVKVRDRGVGIPKDKQQLIFERYGQVGSSLTRQAEGAGIGLTLVKLLVEALDGEIAVVSEEGKGSTFMVSLPDAIVKEAVEEGLLQDLCGNRLVQSTAIEFSDIYT